MKSQTILRSLLWFIGGTVLLSIPAATTSLEACGESGACTQLRATTYANKEVWDACDPNAPDPNGQCIFVAGNPKDCTGVLTCEFAVNTKYRADAELAVYSIGQQSQGCYLCAIPECISGALGYCEPVSRRCILVSGFTSTGNPIGGGIPDAGPTTAVSVPSTDQ